MTSDQVEAAARALGPLAKRDVPIGPLTTYRVGGRTALLVEVTTEEELRSVSDAVQSSGVGVLVVGRGSNLLVADAGFPGLAVTMGGAFADIDVAGTRVRS